MNQIAADAEWTKTLTVMFREIRSGQVSLDHAYQVINDSHKAAIDKAREQWVYENSLNRAAHANKRPKRKPCYDPLCEKHRNQCSCELVDGDDENCPVHGAAHASAEAEAQDIRNTETQNESPSRL